MLRFLLDTDHITLFEHGHPRLGQRMALQSPGTVGVGVVTVEESLRGRLASLAQAPDGRARIARYAQLQQSIQLFQQLPVVPFDQASENQFQTLRSMHLRVGTQDLKIAAITLANKLTLLTRNRRDFGRIPGLLFDDWSV